MLFSAFVFIHLSSFAAQLLLSALLLVFFGGISLWYFKHYGIFLNFIFSMLGMQALAVIRECEDLFLETF